MEKKPPKERKPVADLVYYSDSGFGLKNIPREAVDQNWEALRNMVKTEKEKKNLEDLRWDCEMRLANACRKAEDIVGKNYKCTCPDPKNWSREKCEKFLKEKCLDELVKEAKELGLYDE